MLCAALCVLICASSSAQQDQTKKKATTAATAKKGTKATAAAPAKKGAKKGQKPKTAPPPEPTPPPVAPEPTPPVAEPVEEEEAPPPPVKKKKKKKVVVEPEEEETEEQKPKEEPSALLETSARHPVAIDLALGPRLFWRKLAYTNDYAGMDPYNTSPVAGSVALAIEWYPGAPYTNDFGANIGIIAGLNYAFGLQSTYTNADAPDLEGSYKTDSYQYEIGLKLRIPISDHEIGLSTAYGAQVFAVNLPDPTPTAPTVPDVSYHYIRPRASVRLAVAKSVAITGGASYVGVLTAGEIRTETYFPWAKVRGADFDLGMAFEVARHFEIRPSFDYRRYFFTLNTIEEDPFFVEGAYDRYIGVNVLGAYRQ